MRKFHWTAALCLWTASTVLAQAPERLVITAGKSMVLDSASDVTRVAVANEKVADAMGLSPREVLINGKAPSETTLIVWSASGTRTAYDLVVLPSSSKAEAVQEELRKQLPSQDVSLTVRDETVFLSGTVKDETSARRALMIAEALGKVVNLLRVEVPPAEPQILLKVRFANVDRAASSELGANLLSTGALNTVGSVTTGQFTPPVVGVKDGGAEFTLGDALNVFLFRPDLNLGATIKALQSKRLLEILAEPNVLAMNGEPASFVAGGEFPFPTLQGGGAGLGAVTIQFREFGVRINFLPFLTPRGSIRLQVTPEVSSLDFANGLVFQGFNIPALATRRVQTEVELQSGQSFAIAGLLDNRVAETLNRVPGIGDIPVLGRLFRSRALTKNSSELLVMVTPELVRPIPEGKPLPEIEMPEPFLPREAGLPVPAAANQKAAAPPVFTTVPVEELNDRDRRAPTQTPGPPVQLLPIPLTVSGQTRPSAAPAEAQK